MTFRQDMRKFATKCEMNNAAVYIGAAQLALRSVQYGSDLTGSLGQPVQSRRLLESWVLEPIDARRAIIYTESPYALSNEDGIARPGGGPYMQRSTRGGRWSVRKTRSGWQRIVEYVASTLAEGRRVTVR
jgi:hypothetical protein